MTSSHWWQLPGPGRFLEHVIRDLRAGKNVVLCLPEYAPSGLFNAVRERLRDDRMWESLRPPDAENPVSLLYRRFVPNATPGALWDAFSLVREHDFGGLLWVEIQTKKTWEAWKQFTEKYQAACRGAGELNYAQLVVALEGEVATSPPEKDALLSVRPWKEVVDSLDMLLLAADILRDKPIPPLQKRVAVSIIAQLARWDPEVVERLSAESLGQIYQPHPVLIEIAKERNWSIEVNACWHRGMQDTFEGRTCFHPAYSALLENGEIQRRVWSGQVQVIFPYLEERRHDLIEGLHSLLHAPDIFPRGKREELVEDINEFELTHIYQQIRRNYPSRFPDLEGLLALLKDMRDDLAHLRPLDPAMLKRPELEQFDRILAEASP